MSGQEESCPICRSPPQGPFTTRCGHVFCYECITTHLQRQANCPLCAAFVTVDSLTPHPPPERSLPSTPPIARTPVLTDQLTTRRAAPPPLPRREELTRQSPASIAARLSRAEARAAAALDTASSSSARFPATPPPPQPPPPLRDVPPAPDVLLAAGEHLSADQLANVIAQLSQRLQEKEGLERRVETELLLHFLRDTRREKQTKIDSLLSEVQFLDADLHTAELLKASLRPETSSATSEPGESSKRSKSHEEEPDSVLVRKRARLSRNFDVLQTHYFSTVAKQNGDDRKRALRSFTDDIYKLTQYNRFQDRATLMHVVRVPDAPCNDVFKASNIVSSIEFDRDCEFLATAGVTRRIKIFEFANITRNLSDVHYPVREIPTNAKLSWVCWNPYIRHHLVSSDYEGIVTLWDVNRGAPLREYEEHENRAWSVDYCPARPSYFASGSDDGRVKLWTTSQRNSVLTIDNKPANVCSVKFHPTRAEKLAFGSVDFNVHYYDLRNPNEPCNVFKSHTRAVSYVKFMSPNELVSASVDSTVKLWDLSTESLARTFTGHMNDKNFVGLSVTPDYIACGSEENTVYSYYKAIPRPFTGYRFSSVDPLTGEEIQDDDDSQFVSSVCWHPTNPSMLVAANSLGTMKVLQLDTGDNDNADDEEEGESSGRRDGS